MLPLLAEFTPLSPSAQLAIFSLLTVVVTLVSLWSMLRRRPPLDAQIAKFEATIAGLKSSVDELTEAQRAAADHDSRIRQLEVATTDLRRMHESCSLSHRADQQRVTREWFDRIEKVENGMAKNIQTMEGAIGRIEGTLAILVADR